MFAYCGNNPANGCDSSGARPWYLDGDGNPVEELLPVPINGQGRDKYRDISYGISTVGHAGCEPIAVYNMLIKLGYRIPFEEVKCFLMNYSEVVAAGD